MLAAVNWAEVTIGGFILFAFIVLALIWAGRHDTTKLVRFGFFFERRKDEPSVHRPEDGETQIIERGEKEEE